MTVLHRIEFYSGVAWIPYCLFMAYLFYEQVQLRRYPQYLIIFFLLVDCVLRCIWFLANSYDGMIGYLTISRVAILCQFTALSLLIMMWARILKVTASVQIEPAGAPQTKNPLPIESEFSDLSSLESSSLASSIRPGRSQQGRQVNTALNQTLLQNQLWSHTMRLEREWERQSTVYLWVMIVVNIIVWAIILVSIILSTKKTYEDFYAYNIMLISFLCLLETFIIMGVGINTGLRISREMAPVFVHTSMHDKEAIPVFNRLCRWISVLTLCCKQPESFELHCQAKAVQKLLRVSCIIGGFFLIRSIGFCLTAIYTDILDQGTETTDLAYPWFFYQFPEFFPNLAMAYGVSPPTGLIRRWLKYISDTLCCVKAPVSRHQFGSYKTREASSRAVSSSQHFSDYRDGWAIQNHESGLPFGDDRGRFDSDEFRASSCASSTTASLALSVKSSAVTSNEDSSTTA